MTQAITLPLWVVVFLAIVFAYTLFDKVLLPALLRYLRKQSHKTIDAVSNRLKIPLRTFQLTERSVLIDRLINDPEVIHTINETAQNSIESRQDIEAKVRRYAKEIIPDFNGFVYFRLGYWLAKRIARLLYRVRVGFVSNQSLQDIDSDATVVFVINHRSNMDYILMSYLASEDTTLSYAVGEWANFWPMRPLVRGMGAFFVRRESGDSLYRKVLERYVNMATNEGVCQAVFPEGGLSHDGAFKSPKLGYLDYILRHYNYELHQDFVREIVFVPVGINYDRTLEDRSLLHRIDPNAPRRSQVFVIKTAITFLIKSLRLDPGKRLRRFGYANVNFGAPISMREYCFQNKIKFAKLTREQRFFEIDKLASYLMTAIKQITPILPVPLIAQVLLDHPSKPLTAFEIKLHVLRYFDRARRSGAPISYDERPREGTVMHSLYMLSRRGIVLFDQERYRANEQELELLHYYANSIKHWYDDLSTEPVTNYLTDYNV